MACLGEETLLALASGALEGAVLDDAVAHLDSCEDCRHLAALLAAGDAPRAAPLAEPPRTLGRYVLLNLIGAGAMGVVYRAYDPELDRKVALKVLRPDPAPGADPSQGRARLQREAQALARLAHPNVVAVHDVGSVGEDVFVAMELVEGPTLRQWLHERERGWREVLALLAQAGRGLAAAHAAGLVHRDFKPENVLVGHELRARVTDFGLARPEASLDQAAGTPAYMAPEQRLGQCDPRSDLFSFCVTLWEALYGERPFAGATPAALLDEVCAGRLRPPPASARVPGWVRKAVERGLAAAPDARYPSMEALLEVLAKDPASARRRSLTLAAGLVAVALVIGAIVGGSALQSGRCQGSALKLQGVWDAPRREAAERAFAATGKPFARDAFASAARALDAWAGSWVAMRTDACLATRVRAEQSEELLDRRMACLDRKLAELSALAEIFGRADATVAERAVEASSALGDLRECADRERLLATIAPPEPARRAAVETVRRHLAEAKAHRDAGSYSRAVEIARAALASAHEIGYAPVEAEAAYALGDAQAKAGDYASGERTLREALGRAEAAGADEVAAKAALRLAQVNGGNQLRLAEATIWADLAQAKAERLGKRPELQGAVAYARAMLLQRAGRWSESLSRCREALPLLEASEGAQSPRVAEVERLMGSLLLEDGDLVQARAHHERALAIWTATVGLAHPDVAMSLSNLGHVRAAAGELDPAEELHRRALEVARAALGEEHPYCANALYNLAAIHLARGEASEAAVQLKQALRIREKAYGPEHPLVAATLGALGEATWRLGEAENGLKLCQRSLALLEKILPADHPGLATPLVGIGLIQLDVAGPAAAREPLERALRLRAAHPGEPQRLAQARFGLARALGTTEPERARALALQARDGFAALGASSSSEKDSVERWLSPARR